MSLHTQTEPHPSQMDGILYRYNGQVCRFSWNGEEPSDPFGLGLELEVEVRYEDPEASRAAGFPCDSDGFTEGIIGFYGDVVPNQIDPAEAGEETSHHG